MSDKSLISQDEPEQVDIVEDNETVQELFDSSVDSVEEPLSAFVSGDQLKDEDSDWDEGDEEDRKEEDDLDAAGVVSGAPIDIGLLAMPDDESELDFEAMGGGADEKDQAAIENHSIEVKESSIGRDLTIVDKLTIMNRRDKGRFLSVEYREWMEFQPTFVESEECETYLKGGAVFRQGNLLILNGVKDSGKRPCALHLAEQSGCLSHATSSTYRYYPPTGDDVPSLVELLSETDTPHDALLIVENAFESRMVDRELTGSSLATLLSLLEDGSRRLLLTTSRRQRDLPDTVEVISAELSEGRLKTLRDQALEHGWPRGGQVQESIKNLITSNWRALAHNLDRSMRIHEFVRLAAANQGKLGNLERLQALSEEIVTPLAWNLAEWFSELEGNELLMAFLVFFFPDLVASDLMTLYFQSVHQLREDGVEVLTDPRGQGIEDLLFKLRISPTEGPLAFDVPGRTEFIGQKAASHRHLLLSLADLMLQRFEHLPGRDSWPLRKGIGGLIGHLGLYDETWMRRRLVHLTRNSSWQQKTVASYALVRLAEEDLRTSKERALRIIRGWSAAGRELRWTAAASLWRIFEFYENSRGIAGRERTVHLQGKVIALLERIITQEWKSGAIREARALAGSNQRKMWWLLHSWRINPVQFSLVHCLQEGPQGCVPPLAEWLNPEKSMSKYAQRDLRKALLQACEEAYQRPSSDLVGCFDRLALAFLATTDSSNQLVRQIFRHLQVRLQHEDSSEQLFRGLLTVCNEGRELHRSRLRRILAETWTDTPQARDIAARLTARSHALDGRFLTPLKIGRALLLYDPGIAVKWQRQLRDDVEEGDKLRLLRHLASILASRFELRLGVLGRVRTWTLEDPLSALLQSSSRFRLLLPVLEEASDWDPSLIVVVSDGPVIDLDDLEGNPAADRMIRISFREATPDDESPVDWTLTGALTEHRLEELEQILEERWIEAQREAPALAWDTLSARLGVHAHMSASEREKILLEACRSLPEPAEASISGDLVHCISGAFSAWAAENFATAVDVLARWLTSPSLLDGDSADADGRAPGKESPRSHESRVAAAVVKTLYRLHRDAPLEEGDDRGLLFDRLAVPLSVAEPGDGVATVLRAVEVWLADAGWSEYLAGHGADGRGRLISWAERFLPGRAEEFSGLLPSLSDDEPEKEMFGDLLQTLAGGPVYQPWPQLKSGRRRGLVVTDALSLSGTGGLGLRLAERILKESPEMIPSIVRLGEVRPIWGPGCRAWADSDKAPPLRFLMPLLEASEIDPASVAFIWVLTSGRILDEGDLFHSPWWPKIWVCSPQAPRNLQWLNPSRATDLGKLKKTEEDLLYEMLIEGLSRGDQTVPSETVQTSVYS